jgi:UDP-glucose 4-epimerase
MILVTGGMGFIGLHTARKFLDAGQSVVLTYHNIRREPEIIKDEIGKRVIPEQVDVTDGARLNEIAETHKIDSIVHLVAPGFGTPSVMDDFRTNMLGLLNVLELSERLGVRRLTLASSSQTYLGLPEGPYREDAFLPIDSRNATEAFKKSFEILGFHFADRTKIDVRAFRVRGVWGPLYYSMVNIPSRVCHAAVKGTEADFTGVPGGTPYEDDETDFCYVKDLAQGIVQLHMADNLTQRCYNLGSGETVQHKRLINAVRAIVPDAKISMQPGSNPRPGPKNPVLDLSKSKEDLGYVPEYKVERGVAEYIDWLKTHPQ